MELETPDFKRCGNLLDSKEKFSKGLFCGLMWGHEGKHECIREEYWPNIPNKLLWRGKYLWT